MNYGKKVKPESKKKMKPIPDIKDKDSLVPKAPNIMESHIRALKGSVKMLTSTDFWKIAAFDALTLIFIWLIILVSLVILDRASVAVVESDAASMLALQQGNMQKYEELQGMKTESLAKLEKIQLLVFAFSAAFIVLAITIFHDAGWYLAKKREVSLKNVGTRYLSNLLWIIKWLIIFGLILLAVPINISTILIIVALLIFIYADPVYRNLYDDQKSAFHNSIRGFHAAFNRPYKYIPFLLSLFTIIFCIILTLNFFQSLPALFMIFSIISLLAIIGWMRHYIIILG